MPAEKEVHDLFEKLIVEISRQDLYDKIWEKSVAGVAEEFNIPYAQLMKQVKASNIPIPPSGYWTKISFGKPVDVIPLDDSTDTMISLYKTTESRIPRQPISTISDQRPITNAKENLEENPTTPALRHEEQATSNKQAESSEPAKTHEPVETYERYGQIYNVYKREKLYHEVWEKPLTEVAKRYKVSDVTIKKVPRLPRLGQTKYQVSHCFT